MSENIIVCKISWIPKYKEVVHGKSQGNNFGIRIVINSPYNFLILPIPFNYSSDPDR